MALVGELQQLGLGKEADRVVVHLPVGGGGRGQLLVQGLGGGEGEAGVADGVDDEGRWSDSIIYQEG